MKRFFLYTMALLFTTAAYGVPARPGLWKTIKTAGGEMVRVQLCGDERHHFWQANDGRRFEEFRRPPVAVANGLPSENTSPAVGTAPVVKIPSGPCRLASSPAFTGHRKGLIILAEFQNKQFAKEHDHGYFSRVANEKGFCEGDYRGSVKDYFLSQSGGLFELDFDVVGPVTVSNNYEYYGQPGTSEVDAHPWEMVVEACELVKEQVDFHDYDWNGDGFVEQVFVLYAGQGQSDSYDVNTIWPHEYQLSKIMENGKSVYGDGHHIGDVIIDTYACSNELTHTNGPSGIGTICHEFSHCMGLPDLYDVDYNGYFGMGHWDIMANGVYNGNAFTPAGYTSYERMVCGWLNPVELNADTVVTAMKALTEGGDAYIIYNKGHRDEYYLLENRQPTGWDEALPSKGLLVLHVDYDERVWRENIVNSVCDYRRAGKPDLWNTHQRLTLIHADNESDKRFWRSSGSYYTQTTEETDAYPYRSVTDEGEMVNDSLTNNSLPAATLYHGNTDGSLFMNSAVQAITQNDDGTMAFRFEAVNEKYVPVDTTMTDKPDLTGAIFYESFDQCIGTGGNDGVFKGGSDVASAKFVPDNGGWDSMVMTGGARCAKFGNAANDGIVTSPAFVLTEDSLQVSFKAAPWSRDDTSLALSIEGDGELTQNIFEMTEGQWTTFSTTLRGKKGSAVKLTFTPGRRFFLDEVVVRKVNDGMLSVESGKWSVEDGKRYMDGVLLTLPKDIVIVRMPDGSVRKLFLTKGLSH